jgi:hypothetical protein
MKTIISYKLKSFGLKAVKGSLLAGGFIWMLLIVIGNAYPQFAKTPALLRVPAASMRSGGPGLLIYMLGSAGSTPITTPILSSINPVSATAGGPGFVLIAYGLNFTTSSTLSWNGSVRPTTYVSSSQLQMQISASDIATAGTAVVTMTTGSITSSIGFAITDSSITTPTVAPALSSISPSSATAGGPGFVLTAYGTNFSSTSVIKWNNSSRPTTYMSATQLKAEVSASDIATAGIATVTVWTGNLSTYSGKIFTITDSSTGQAQKPSLASISPNSASAGGPGFVLTVTGSNFATNSVVLWACPNLSATSVRPTTYVSSTQLQASISESDIPWAGTAIVQVNTPYVGISSVLPFTVTSSTTTNPNAPSLTSISPTSASAGGPWFVLTLNGSNFTTNSTIYWNGGLHPTFYVSANQLQTNILASDIAVAGTGSVFVSNPGIGASSALSFTITPSTAFDPTKAPFLASVSPSSVKAGGSAFDLAVAGSNFTTTTFLYWNGSIRQSTYMGANQLICYIPASDIAMAGTASLTVRSSGSSTSTVTSNAIPFTITGSSTPDPAKAPSLASIVPNFINAGGPGFVLTAYGSNFTSASVVQWNGSSRATTYTNSGQLQANILPSDIAVPGTASIAIYTPGAGTTSSMTFTIGNSGFYISALNPGSITAGSAGFTLEVTGSNFSSNTVVQWDGTSRNTTFVDSHKLRAAISASDVVTSRAVPITAMAADMGLSNTLLFFVSMPPKLNSISPSVGIPGGPGFVLTAFGSCFLSNSVIQWNGSNRATTYVSAGQLQANILAADVATAGVFNVAIDTPGLGFSNSLPFRLAVPSPVLSSIIPNSAAAGESGFVLTALGTNGSNVYTSSFTPSSVIQWNGFNRATTFINSTQLQAAIPASDIASSGTANVTVSTPGIGVSYPLTFTITASRKPLSLSMNAGGAVNHRASSGTGPAQTGYATIKLNSGANPFGTAVYSIKQNGITASEVGVSPSPPTYNARIFVDYRLNVTAVPGRADSGTVDVNTGVAIVNYGADTASVTLLLRDLDGNILATGHGTIEAAHHIAKFIGQLKDVAPDFELPPSFQTKTQFGSLEIQSDQVLSVLAMRGVMNQREEFLLTTTPIADLSQSPGYVPAYFPQFGDGGGYTTSLVLLNTSNEVETGILQFVDDSGALTVVHPVGGSPSSVFLYSIPAGGVFHLQTDGASSKANVGWVRLIPESFTPTPVGLGIFSFNPESILVSESGIPATNYTTHARVYIDLSKNHNTGLALGNPGDAPQTITLSAYERDGITRVGNGEGTLRLAGNAHTARFANQLIQGLPSEYTGVFDVNSDTPFAALTMRFLSNERSEFLMSTLPLADPKRVGSLPILFPQIADGGDFATEFIFLSPAEPSSITLGLFSEAGASYEPED